MQVLISNDPLGGLRYTSRETGKSCVVQSEPTHFARPMHYVYQGGMPDVPDMHVTCKGAWQRRALAMAQVERLLS